MEKKIGIIGHIDHDKTTLTADISSVISSTGLQEPKTINEIIEDENSIKIYQLPKYNLTSFDIKNGNQSRRERRAKDKRKKKKD